MNNVLFVYERKFATVNLLIETFDTIFCNRNIYYAFKKISNVNSSDIEDADTIILIRPHNYLSQKIAEKAAKCGCFVIFFIDDDLFMLPETMPSIPWRNKALEKVLKNSHMMLSSSPYLLNKYKKYTIEKRGAIIHTVVSKDEINQIPKHTRGTKVTKIVYAAGNNHAVFFEELVSPILAELDRLYGENVSLTFVGVHPEIDIEKYTMEIIYQRGLPFFEYREYMRKQRFDIGLAPLFENDFTKCKYFNKYLEYSISGAVGIYSFCEPYTYVIKDGMNGMLAKNSKEDWLRCISKLMDCDIRNQCLENAIRQLKEQFNSTKIYETLINEVPEFIECRRKNKCNSLKLNRIIYRFSRGADIVYLTMFYLKRIGVKGVVKKICMHIKESKSAV